MIHLLEGKPKRLAYFDMSNDLLAELLKLPDGTVVHRVTDAECMGPLFRVVIEHHEFDFSGPGEPIKAVRPMYESHYGDSGEFLDFQFKEW